MDNCLVHHGILGQRWGVRRFQNKDGSLTVDGKKRYKVGKRTEDSYKEKTIPTGHTFYRVAGKGEQLQSGRGVYVVSSQVDRDNVKYISGWLADKRKSDVSDLEEKEFVTTKDIKVASLQDLQDAQRKILQENPQYAKTASFNYFEEKLTGDPYDETRYISRNLKESESKYADRLYDFYSKNYGADEFWKDQAKQDAHYYFEGRQELEKAISSYGKVPLSQVSADPYVVDQVTKALDNEVAASKKYQEAVIKELSNKGFNAMYDNNMNNAGRSTYVSEADEALVLFDKDSITEVGNHSLSGEEISTASENVKKYKQGQIKTRSRTGHY